MPREETLKKKAEAIEGLKETFDKCTIGILTDYRGLTNQQLTELRRKLRESGIQFKVVKNTMARFAAEKSGKGKLVGLLEGPVAIVFGYDEITAPAKTLTEYIRATKSTLAIKGAFASDTVFTPAEVTALSLLPSKEVLIGKVVGGIKGPLYILVGSLNSPLRGFMGILQARIQQLENTQPATEAKAS
ncbi:MAG: 50S ribosomal protein L10 [Chloroflexi bacterium]|nr:50S ribosomal protein L10 [Chloroflexota bacterium]